MFWRKRESEEAIDWVRVGLGWEFREREREREKERVFTWLYSEREREMLGTVKRTEDTQARRLLKTSAPRVKWSLYIVSW